MIVKSNQSVFDICTQETGDVKSALDYCIANNWSLTQDLTPSENIVTPSTIYKVDVIQGFFESKNITLSTGKPATQLLTVGIGQMLIGESFDIT